MNVVEFEWPINIGDTNTLYNDCTIVGAHLGETSTINSAVDRKAPYARFEASFNVETTSSAVEFVLDRFSIGDSSNPFIMALHMDDTSQSSINSVLSCRIYSRYF